MKEITEFDTAADMVCGEISSLLHRIPGGKKQTVHEIRMRTGKPLVLSDGTETLFVCPDGQTVYSPERAFCCTARHIYDSFRQLCGYSVYSRQDEIRNGFITVSGGHRIGLCGTAVLKDDSVSAVTDITSLNIRIARQISGAAAGIIPQICPLRGGVLIAGAPSTGKTTILRDLAYRLSTGQGCRIYRTCVIDERGELSGAQRDGGGLDLGLSDIMRGYPKQEGIIQALRSLSPQVIICDEIGAYGDAYGIAAGVNAGVRMIVSAHAGSREELLGRRQIRAVLDTGAIETVIILSDPDRPGQLGEVLKSEELMNREVLKKCC